MAKLEIPSIVVQSGSHNPTMDHSPTRSQQWSLSTQSTLEDESEALASSQDMPFPESNINLEDKAEQSPPPHNNHPPTRQRSKGGNLKLLKRSHAIKESTSPPPEICLSPTSVDFPSANNNNNNNGLCPRQNSESSGAATLSRGNSLELQNGPQSLEEFISKTLNKNSKDRNFVLKLESDLISFVNEPMKDVIKFSTTSSYQRMIVHRVAHYFGLEHHVDLTSQSVLVQKGKNTRLPDRKFTEFIRSEMTEEPRKSILKRDSASFEDPVMFKSPERQNIDGPRRSKSFEEREEEYINARRRIFHQEQENLNICQRDDDIHWNGWNGSEHNQDSTKLHPNRNARLTKVESYEGKDTLRANSLRSSVSKSFSFGGYDQNCPNTRVLTKQDSGSSSVSSRVSPSSSGYKSQSQRSDTTMSATPSPTATPHLTAQSFRWFSLGVRRKEDGGWLAVIPLIERSLLPPTMLSNQSGVLSPEPEQVSEPDHDTQTVMWAVTNMSAVPTGSVLINPKTGQPFKNDDGSVYHYDPENPPKIESKPRKKRSGVEVNGHDQRELPRPATMDSEGVSPSQVGTNQQVFQLDTQMDIRQHLEQQPPASYHHLPPPPPPSQPVPLSYSTAPTNYSPIGQISYGLMTSPQSNPVPSMVYNVSGASAMPYLPAFPTPEDFCGFLMGMKISDSSHRPSAYYFSGPPTEQCNASSMPVYAAPAGPVPAQRYSCTFPPAEQPRPGGELTFQQQPVHTYYPNCTTSICPTNGGGPTNTANQMVAMAPNPRPPPNMPQSNGCSYPMLSHTYGPVYSHFTNPPPQMTLPPLLRPALQMNVCNSPPLQGPRPTALYTSTARRPAETVRLSHPPHHQPMPMYPFTPYPASGRLNEFVVLNTPRPPMPPPLNNARHPTANLRRARRNVTAAPSNASNHPLNPPPNAFINHFEVGSVITPGYNLLGNP